MVWGEKGHKPGLDVAGSTAHSALNAGPTSQSSVVASRPDDTTHVSASQVESHGSSDAVPSPSDIDDIEEDFAEDSSREPGPDDALDPFNPDVDYNFDATQKSIAAVDEMEMDTKEVAASLHETEIQIRKDRFLEIQTVRKKF